MARGSGMSGDFRKLAKFISKFSGAEGILTSVARNASEEALTLIAQGFQRETDPYGEAWAQLKQRQGKILQDTGRMRSSWHRVQLDKTGFRIASAAEYAKYHQTGTKRMVARPMIPKGGVLPASWRLAITDAANEALAAHFAK